MHVKEDYYAVALYRLYIARIPIVDFMIRIWRVKMDIPLSKNSRFSGGEDAWETECRQSMGQETDVASKHNL